VSHDELIALARRWLACFAAKDVDALVGLYADDAEHTTPKRKGAPLVGRTALREWWADAFRRIPDLRYEELALTADERRGAVFMEYRRIAPGEPDLIVAEILETAGGQITRSRVYHG
jgi:ketosteroid isomerase-like protein